MRSLQMATRKQFLSPKLEKSPCSNENPAQPKKKLFFKSTVIWCSLLSPSSSFTTSCFAPVILKCSQFLTLEKGMATHSSRLTWKIPWMEKPGGPQSMGSQRVRHDWMTNSFLPHALIHAVPSAWNALPTHTHPPIHSYKFPLIISDSAQCVSPPGEPHPNWLCILLCSQHLVHSWSMNIPYNFFFKRNFFYDYPFMCISPPPMHSLGKGLYFICACIPQCPAYCL